jgi:large conductance mechanosensitive channel
MIGVPASTARHGGKNEGLQGLRYAGYLVELAVAFIMAAAFAAVVTTFTNWLLSLIPAGATNFGDQVRVVPHRAGVVPRHRCGRLFFHRHPVRKVKARFGKQEAEASDPDDIVLLKEIRDLLASRQGGAV